jgi:D-aminopeptidase
MRFRDLGLTVGQLAPGPLNAITDVEGVRVGHTTLIRGEGPLVVGRGPVRTGVTVVVPHEEIEHAPLFAGCHRLNGNGEMTGLEWVRESGTLTTPVAITNTHSVGVVRDALVAADVAKHPQGGVHWSLPVVAETYDGDLSDINGMHVRAEHLHQALASATGGPVIEGNVGGGTGMICHDFKGGIGTASRRLAPEEGRWTVGVLVQANHGMRERLTVDGVPVGLEITRAEIPGPEDQVPPGLIASPEAGSIIVILATDAPLLPHQCDRLAQRAGLGIARAGGSGAHSSGDLFLCFSTANRGRLGSYKDDLPGAPVDVRMLPDTAISQLFWAAIEATEEAILNALCAAEMMTGRDGITVYTLPKDRLLQVMATYGRGSAH